MTFPRDLCHCISMCELLLQSPNKVDVSKWGKQPWVERGSPNKADCKDRGSGELRGDPGIQVSQACKGWMGESEVFC